MVVGLYFTNWSIYDRGCKPSQLPLDCVTHIFYAFGKPDPGTGAITLSDAWADIQKPMHRGGLGCLGEFRQLKQEFPHLRVLFSVGGYSYTPMMDAILRDQTLRCEFVRSAVQLVAEHALDGIDLDWEYPSCAQDAAVYVSLVKELRTALPRHLELTIASPAGQHNLQFIDLRGMDPYVSFWNVMTYDFAGPWSAQTDHHSALYSSRSISVASVIEYYERYIAPAKLVIGIPLYGRSFAHTKGLGTSFKGSLPGSFEQGVHDFKSLPLKGFHEEVRDGGCICTDGRSLVSYDNRQTVIAKAHFVKTHRLAGAMFWEASGDAQNSLVRAFAHEL